MTLRVFGVRAMRRGDRPWGISSRRRRSACYGRPSLRGGHAGAARDRDLRAAGTTAMIDDRGKRWVKRIVDAVLADGFAMLTSTTVFDRHVLRMCTINPQTTETDLRETLDPRRGDRVADRGSDLRGVCYPARALSVPRGISTDGSLSCPRDGALPTEGPQSLLHDADFDGSC